MIKQFVAKFLQVSEDQAEALIGILRAEGCATQTQILLSKSGKTYEIVPRIIKSQSEFIHLLRAVAQSKWGKGQVYTPQQDRLLGKREPYLALFKKAGVLSEESVQAPPQTPEAVSATFNDCLSKLATKIKEAWNQFHPREYQIALDAKEQEEFFTMQNRLALEALPDQYIVSCLNDEAILTLAKLEKSTCAWGLLECLVQYRRVRGDTSTRYDKPEDCTLYVTLKELYEKNEKVKPERKGVRAAILNLLALVLQNVVKDYESAAKIYTMALNDSNTLQPELTASLTSNYLTLLLEKKDFESAFKGVKELIQNKYLVNLPLNYPENRKIAGAIYAAVGTVFLGREEVDCVEYFNRANELWPELESMADKLARAATLSKMHSPEALNAAERILKEAYSLALRNDLFEVLYYRADVNLKLAACEPGNKNAYLKTALEALANAGEALRALDPETKIPKYQAEQIDKSLAKLCYLQSNYAALKGKYELCLKLQQEAVSWRARVTEPKAKKHKFQEKFYDVTEAFNASLFFREKRRFMKVSAESKAVIEENSTPTLSSPRL